MQWTGRLRSLVSVVMLTAVTGAGCSSIQSSATPPSQPIDLTGTWRGNFPVQAVTSEMVWTLTQSGSSVSGPVLVRLPNGVVLLNGFLTGTLSGSSLAYTISVGQQGIPTQPACAGQLGGTMTARTGTTSTLTGGYTVTSTTCTPPFASSGDLLLTR
jgi:hypothetical protein